ncbi:hemolysin family protein [Rhodosalinus sp.]|uniref:hemolysin family protein n=1 Tax=Rhodosalinus sp. TaxID=2047741 RepID=UPI0035645DB7
MDGSDDSSSAAHGAQDDPPQSPDGGLWRRLLDALNPAGDEDTPDEEGADGTPADRRQTHGLVNLRRLRVEDVAIPKAEIVAIPDSVTRDELVGVFRESGLTRLPVYHGTLDTPVGMLHLKDFALKHGFNGDGQDVDIGALLRPLLYVPPSMPIGVLLTKMQSERRHMALVIDEYGGVDGLLTIEDLIEQVVGEIEDEHDTDEDALWVREKAGCYLAQARTTVEEFEQEIGIDLSGAEGIDSEEIDTLGGLVFMLSGRVPARGEVVEHPTAVEFEVVDADPRRIKRLRIRVPETPDV